MIVSTFNVRGLGGRIKKNKIRELVRQHNIDFLALQETKIEEVTPLLCYSIWGSEDCDWVFRASEGNSGGILSIWRKSCATLLYSFQGEGYVGVCLEWGVERIKCFLINVYSKCDLPGKRRLWDNLVGERQSREGGAWCVLGDFNVVRRRDERRGVNAEASAVQILEMFLFNSFLWEMDMEDLNVLGRRFTWYHPNGRSMSRIDRMLNSEEWARVWGENALWVMPRDVSDHCPLVLQNGVWNWGPTPFRFNNFWLQNSDFKGIVEEAWMGQNISGWMSFVLKVKLKGLKLVLKEWSREEYGGIEDRVEKLVEDIKILMKRGRKVG
jgi:exonuclease III